MTAQERFLTVKNGDETVETLKTYEQEFARAAFGNMDAEVSAYLASSLKPGFVYQECDIPTSGGDSCKDFIWDVLVDEARKDSNTCSYFVVTKSNGLKAERLFLSGDWLIARAYIKLMGLSGIGTSQSPPSVVGIS
jgi:hypothetical protein